MAYIKGTFTRRFLLFVKYQSPAILWGLFIIVILLLPAGETQNTIFFDFIPLDKVVHFVLFSLFSLFCRVGWAKLYRGDYFAAKANYLSVLCGLSLAFFTEALQWGTSYRTFSLLDILADFIGILFGLLIFYIIYKL